MKIGGLYNSTPINTFFGGGGTTGNVVPFFALIQTKYLLLFKKTCPHVMKYKLLFFKNLCVDEILFLKNRSTSYYLRIDRGEKKVFFRIFFQINDFFKKRCAVIPQKILGTFFRNGLPHKLSPTQSIFFNRYLIGKKWKLLKYLSKKL